MDPWGRSSFSDKITSWLVEVGLLCPVMNAVQPEWIIPGNGDEPNPPPTTSSASHTSICGGFGTPASNFFSRAPALLFDRAIESQPQLLQITVFVTLCDGNLGIKPNFALWKYYFYTTIFFKTVRRGKTVSVRMDSCAI
jgi:hypothetical protein